MDRAAVVALQNVIERALEDERLLIEGVSVGTMDAAALTLFGQSFEGKVLELTRNLLATTTAAMDEARRLGLVSDANP